MGDTSKWWQDTHQPTYLRERFATANMDRRQVLRLVTAVGTMAGISAFLAACGDDDDVDGDGGDGGDGPTATVGDGIDDPTATVASGVSDPTATVDSGVNEPTATMDASDDEDKPTEEDQAEVDLTAEEAGTATEAGLRPAKTIAGDGYSLMEGMSEGAMFAVLRPDAWNGSLVVMLHGAVPPTEPVELPADPFWTNLVDRLISEGYGVAYSSYRVNGFAVAEGMIDSRMAETTFTDVFGKPDATYLMGLSMGTHVGQKLIETSSSRYDGFLAICSSLGGTTLQMEYFINARILFDYYFPDVLPGGVWSETDPGFAFPAVEAAIMESPEAFERAKELAGIDQLNIPWATDSELVISIAILASGDGSDLKAKAGGIPLDNTETYYTGSSDDEALNAGIERFAADPNAEQYLQEFDPNGMLQETPILALHTTRDPIVQHQIHYPAYQAVLAETGNEHLFATRIVDRFDHCTLSADEIIDAFQELANWAETGVAPQP